MLFHAVLLSFVLVDSCLLLGLVILTVTLIDRHTARIVVISYALLSRALDCFQSSLDSGCDIIYVLLYYVCCSLQYLFLDTTTALLLPPLEKAAALFCFSHLPFPFRWLARSFEMGFGAFKSRI